MEAAVEMEHVARVDVVFDEAGSRGIDVFDNQKQSLHRARYGSRYSLTEDDRAWRAGRRELDYAPIVTRGEIGVQAPPQIAVERLGAIDIGHRNDYHLEFH